MTMTEMLRLRLMRFAISELESAFGPLVDALFFHRDRDDDIYWDVKGDEERYDDFE